MSTPLELASTYGPYAALALSALEISVHEGLVDESLSPFTFLSSIHPILPLVASVTLISLLLLARASPKTVLQGPGRPRTPLTLVSIDVISHNVKEFTFALPSSRHRLGLPVGAHVSVAANIAGEEVVRSYTPIRVTTSKDTVTLLIKKYPNGRMTNHLDSLSIGSKLDFGGPTGSFRWYGHGAYSKGQLKAPVKKSTRALMLLAGGSGITPMLQIMDAVAADPTDKTPIYLIFANQTEEDILMRDHLEDLVKQRPEQFHVWCTIDKASPEWKQGVGFINADMIRDHGPPSIEGALALVCGPPPMIKYACVPSLEKLGYPEDLIVLC